MFGFVGMVLLGAVLVGWVGVAIWYAAKFFKKGYGPRSFIDKGSFGL